MAGFVTIWLNLTFYVVFCYFGVFWGYTWAKILDFSIFGVSPYVKNRPFLDVFLAQNFIFEMGHRGAFSMVT